MELLSDTLKVSGVILDTKNHPYLSLNLITFCIHFLPPFRLRLSQLEDISKYHSTKGYSRCRLCGCMNGSKQYSVPYIDEKPLDWPEGLQHYYWVHWRYSLKRVL